MCILYMLYILYILDYLVIYIYISIYLSLYLLYPGLCGQGPAGLRGQGAGAAW